MRPTWPQFLSVVGKIAPATPDMWWICWPSFATSRLKKWRKRPTRMQGACSELTQKIKIQEVLVVEGKDDTANLKRFYEVDTYETRGSAISDDDLERIEKLHDLRGVIVFTDPDYNGERIRKMIMQAIPTVKHAFYSGTRPGPSPKQKGGPWALSTPTLRTWKKPSQACVVTTMMKITLTSPSQT